MKKLMIAAAALMVGVAAQAANYSWNMKAGWISPDDNDGLAGAKVYFFNAGVTDQSELMKNLTMANIEAAALASDAGAYAVTGGEGNFNVLNPEGVKNFVGGDIGDTASMFALLLADGANSKTYAYVLTPMDDVTIGSSHTSGSPLLFTIDDTITGAVGGSGWTEVQTVPEPTSGLLLLLGVAGLALRRRRA